MIICADAPIQLDSCYGVGTINHESHVDHGSHGTSYWFPGLNCHMRLHYTMFAAQFQYLQASCPVGAVEEGPISRSFVRSLELLVSLPSLHAPGSTISMLNLIRWSLLVASTVLEVQELKIAAMKGFRAV